MRKMLVTLLTCCMMLAALTVHAVALTPQNGKCGDNVYWSVDSSGTLTISGTGSMAFGDYSAAPWVDYYNYDEIRKIIIKEGVTSVAHEAFTMRVVDSISLPSSLRQIDLSAFSNVQCSSFITIPNGVETIGRYAFNRCEAPGISMPGSVKYVGECAFKLSSITSADLSGATTICQDAFRNCEMLKTSVYLGSVKEMGSYVFAESGVTGVTFGPQVTALGSNAFYRAKNLKSVTIPGTMTRVASGAFEFSGLEQLTLEEGVNRIEDSAFASTHIKKLDCPKSLRYIDNRAFSSSYLTTVKLNDGLRQIGDGAFNCNGLTCIELPDSLTQIGASAFATKAMKQVIVPENCTMKTWEWGGAAIAMAGQPRMINADTLYSFYSQEEWYGALESKKISRQTFHQLEAEVLELNPFETVPLEPGSYTVLDDRYLTLEDGVLTGKNPGYTVLTRSAEGKTTCQLVHVKPLPFVDISVDKYYCRPVCWAVEQKIVFGMDETHFVPKGNCTRAQIVSMLWRLAGSPEPETTECPFEDVAKERYYYKAVQWAVENNITVGVTETAFMPNKPCTRAEAVTFLWRFAGGKAAELEENPFEDVPEKAYYYNAVLWGAENHIVYGKTETSFAPGAVCNRGEIVSFIYRYVENRETADAKPDENPDENPGEDPDKNPDENPGEDPDKTPDENPDENPGGDSGENPDENPGGDSDENPDENPGGDSNENPPAGEV